MRWSADLIALLATTVVVAYLAAGNKESRGGAPPRGLVGGEVTIEAAAKIG